MSGRRKILHGLLASGLTLLLAGGIEFMAHQQQQRDIDRNQLQLASQAGELRAQLLNELNSTLYLASGLVSYIQGKNGVIRQREIQQWLQNMVRQARTIRNISLAPDNRISMIYPSAGNEPVMGLYYPDLPEQWPAVQQAILSRRPLLAGPIQLKQGGDGLIYRSPVFLADSRYWGMVSTVLDVPPLLAQTQEVAKKLQLDVTLARQPVSEPSAFMLGDPAALDKATIRLELPVPGGQWVLGVSSLKPAQAVAPLDVLHVLGWLVAAVLGILVWLMLRAADRRALAQLDLLESRQRFSQAFETAPQGMALISPQGQWLEVNAQLCELLHYSATDLRNSRLWQILASDDHALARQQLDSARTSPVQWEACLLDIGGQPIDCQLSAAWLKGQQPSLILQCQDIRESKRLSKLKSEFVSTVSHELRTPLTSIAGALDLIAGGALGELPLPMRGMFDIALQNSQRLNLLINDLLDIEKLEAGMMRFELNRHSLLQQLQEALISNNSYAAPMGVTYRLHEVADVQVEVDPLRLQQVLSNLLSNAAKFSPRGSSVDISWVSSGTHVRVSIHDHGAGIPSEFHSRIFSKFSQADSSDQRETGGTGLGLAISKKLMEHMHGRIGFVSEPGAGTTFWFELPLPAQPPSAAPAVPHLLVVEDDDAIAELLQTLLDANGYANQRAATLEDARRKLAEGDITGLILDLHLPDGHGASLLREMRQHSAAQQLPVIILSAFCAEGRRLLADLLGQIDWLDKPLHPAQLLDLLHQRLQGHTPRPRLLHVEDDADLRKVVAAQAASLADVDGVGSLAEAREQLATHDYQLLLLDIELPDGSGLDLLHEVQCTAPGLPVIILSSSELSAAQLHTAKSRYSQTQLLDLLRQHLLDQPGVANGQH